MLVPVPVSTLSEQTWKVQTRRQMPFFNSFLFPLFFFFLFFLLFFFFLFLFLFIAFTSQVSHSQAQSSPRMHINHPLRVLLTNEPRPSRLLARAEPTQSHQAKGPTISHETGSKKRKGKDGGAMEPRL